MRCVRKGTAPFGPHDLIDPLLFARMFASDHPLAKRLRALPGGAGVRSSLSDSRKADRRILKAVADLLNQARTIDLTNGLDTSGFLSLEARKLGPEPKDRARYNRMLIEDFFLPAIQRVWASRRRVH